MCIKLKKIICIVLISCLLAGCKMGEKSVFVSTGTGFSNAFTMGSLKCSKKEAMLYMAIFADYYGGLGVADKEILLSATSLLTRVYSLNLYAEQKEIALSKEETQKALNEASYFYKQVASRDEQIGLSSKDVENAALRYALAIKVYDSLMEGVDGEVSEDEARVMSAYVIHLNDADKVSQLEKRLKGNSDFATLTQVYSEDDKRIVTFGRNEYPKAVDDVAFTLEEGEISPKIQTDEGIYYIQCVTKYDQEVSEANKSIIINKRQKSLLKQIETEQSENSYSEINQKFFDEVDVSKLKMENAKTFFDSMEKALVFNE